MCGSLPRSIVRLILLVLLLSPGTYGNSSKVVAHNLEHEIRKISASVEHSHSALHYDAAESAQALADAAEKAPPPLSDAEHELLHSFTMQAQLLLVSPVQITLSELTQTIFLSMDSRLLRSAEPESIFHPPKTSAVI